MAATDAAAQSVLPTGGQVARGSVSIGAPINNSLTVNQNSNRAVVNWNTFSIGQPNTVNFNQPDSQAAILNRVTGNTPSNIAGQLNANGQVYLVNPNGIAITPSGTINTGGGFVASTLGISNRNFMSGNLSFTGNGASAPVTNAGTINVGQGGYAGMIGGSVANSGTINVPLGKVGLGAGEKATLDINGDGFMQVTAPSGATTAQGQPLISNSGTINAPGGSVQLQAGTVATAVRDAVNMSGLISANSVSGRNGAVTLSGGPGGNVAVSGAINVSGLRPGQTGGTAVVTGRSVSLGNTARVDARGAAGGGTVKIGGGPRGLDPLVQNALTANISAGAVIVASATDNGNGGHVTLYSTGNTTFAGYIAADGGAAGGSGGTIETSGGQLAITTGAVVSAAAPHGQGGSWLLDPVDLTIDTATATTISSMLSAGSSVLIETAVGGPSGSVMAPQSNGSGNIYINAAIAGGAAATVIDGNVVSNTLTVSAYNNLFVNAPVTISQGTNLSLLSNNAGANNRANITVTAPITMTGSGQLAFTTSGMNPAAGPDPIFVMGQGNAQFTGGAAAGASLTINNNPYTLIYDLTAGPSGMQSTSGAGPNTYYALAQPITAMPAQVFAESPVGSFAGMFDGLGNTITNLSIVGSSGAIGLIGTNSGTISNFGLINETITTANATAVGGLVGVSHGSLNNVYVTGTISDTTQADVGGLVGDNFGTIRRAYASGMVSGGLNSIIGGLVGSNGGGAIQNAYAAITVTATNGLDAGGLVGANNGPIVSAYAVGPVSGATHTGGLVGATAPDLIVSGYWDTTTNPGLDPTAGGIGQGSGDVSPLSTVGLAATLPAGFSSAVWSNVYNQTTPYLISNPGPVYVGTDTSATPRAYSLVFNAAQLQAINNNLSGNYALATAIDLGSAGNFTPIGNTATAYTGTFNGLGNTISNLAEMTSVADAGLFGQLGMNGTIENVGVTSGSVAASGAIANAVGGLVGLNNGTIVNAFVNVMVSSSAGFADVGGLVGRNGTSGTIKTSWASGNVQADNTAASAGGLVGDNENTITDSYAVGNVSGSFSAGGLVGVNNNALNGGVYATGIVSGFELSGGLIGRNTGMVQSGYWDTTTDTTPNIQGVGFSTIKNIAVAGEATTTLAASLPNGFDPMIWGNANNQTTPYLLSNPGPVYLPSDNKLYTAVLTGRQLQAINKNLSGNFVLGNDVDLTNVAVTPIGNATSAYTGTFNGLGNVITNLTIEDAVDTTVGLFGQLGVAGVISNIGIIGGSVADVPPPPMPIPIPVPTAQTPYVGALVGANYGTITNAYSSAGVGDGGSVGGLVGYNAPGATISNSYATGAVNAPSSQAVGGLVGYNGGMIQNAYATGTVTGGSNSYVGGLVGGNYGGTVNVTYAAGGVSGTAGSFGGLAGINTGAVTNSYLDQDRAGTGVGIGTDSNNGTPTTLTGLSVNGNNPLLASSYPAFNFTNNDGAATGNNWVMVSPLDLLPDSMAAQNLNVLMGTLPMLASEYSTTIQNAHQLQLIALNMGASYTLGGTIDATGTGSNGDIWNRTGFQPLGNQAGGPQFSGQFNGGFHAIDNLFIKPYATNDPQYNPDYSQYVGLFGVVTNTGLIENIALIGGSVTGTRPGNGSYVGSLVGWNQGGTITTAYSTAAVSGFIGTLTDNPGALPQIGGLVGQNDGTVEFVYSTGPVSGTGLLGGLIAGGTAPTDGYWDTVTSGVLTGLGTGLGWTMAGAPPTALPILQTQLPAGFGMDTWSIVPNVTYPYFATQYGGAAPTVVSGYVYSDPGGTVVGGAGSTVTALSSGGSGIAIQTPSGANGYYYYTLPPQSVSPGDSLLVYAYGGGAGAVNGGVFTDSVSHGGPQTVGIDNTLLRFTTGTQHLSAAAADFSDLATSGTEAGKLLGSIANLSLPNLQLIATNAGGFNIDQSIGVGTSGNVKVTASGSVSQTAGVITAGALSGSSVGGAAFPDSSHGTFSGNQVSAFGPWSDTGNGKISFVSALDLTTGGTISSSNSISLSSAGTMTVAYDIDAPGASVRLNALTPAGAVTQTGGTITALEVLGNSTGGATLNNANEVSSFGPWTDVGSQTTGISFTATGALATSGAISSTGAVTLISGSLTLNDDVTAGTNSTVKLASSGLVIQTAGSIITAGTLTGTSTGGATMPGANVVGALGAWTNATSGGFSFTDSTGVNLTGLLNAMNNGTVALAISGQITEMPGGAITAGTLTGSAVGGANFNGTAFNNIAILGPFSNTMSGDLVLRNGIDLNVEGSVTTPGALTLMVDNGEPNLMISATMSSGSVMTLFANGFVRESGNGVISAPSLIAVTALAGNGMTNDIDLGGANTITGNVTLASLNVAMPLGLGNGAITFNNTGGFTIAPLMAGTTVPIGTAPSLEPGVSTLADTVKLTAGGPISEAPGGVIQAGNAVYLATTSGAITLGGNNLVGGLAANVTGGGSFAFNNAAPLTIENGQAPTGIVTDGGMITVTTSGAASPLTVTDSVGAGTGTITLNATGDLTLGTKSSVTGGAVTLVTSGLFKNNSSLGGGVITAGTNWLIYGNDPTAANVYGGLVPGFIQYGISYPVAPAVLNTNGFLYSSPETLTINSVTKTYDGTDSLPTALAAYTTSGTINGDTVTGISPVGSYTGPPAPNVGNNIDVNFTGGSVAASQNGIPVYGYLLSANPGPIGQITPALLTVTPNAVSTTYNGMALNNAGYSDTLSNYTIAGLQPQQTLASTGIGLSGSMAFNGSPGTVVQNAGTYTQSVGSLVLSSNFADYKLNFTNPVPNNYVINAAPLTVTPNAVSTTYNGAPLNNTGYSDTLSNYTIAGLQAQETLASAGIGLGGSMAFNGATGTVVQNAGTYSQALGTLVLSSNSGNYKLNFTNPAPNSYVIVPASLTVTPTAFSTTYNGTALNNASYSDTLSNYTITGLQAQETLASAGIGLSGSMAFNGAAGTVVENAGTYTQGVGSLTLSSNNGNYKLSFANPAPNNYVIAPASLTVTPNAVTTTYNGTALNNAAYSDTLSNYTITGLQGSETLASAGIGLSGSMAFNASTGTVVQNAGTYTQGAGSLTLNSNNGNYKLGFANPTPNNYVINPASLTVTPNAVSTTYNGVALNNTAYSDTLSNYTIGGLQAKETLASAGIGLSGSMAFNSAPGTVVENAGTYSQAVGTLVLSSNSGNYKLNFTNPVPNNYVIAPASLTLTPNAVSTTYNGTALNNPGYSDTLGNYTVGGLQGGDTLASAAIKLSGSMAFNGSTTTVVQNAGTYSQSVGSLMLSSTNNNYLLSFTNPLPNNYVVAAAPLTYSANSATRVYGAVNPAFSGSVTGFVGGDTQANATTGNLSFTSGATASSNVGAYAITGSGLTPLSGNYTFVQAPGNATALTITPAALTIAATNQGKTYGQALALGTTGFTATGLVNGDTVGGVTLISGGAAATAGVAGSPYAIVPSAAAGTGLTNYTISYVNGELTINPAVLTASLVGTIGKTYDGTTTAGKLTAANFSLGGTVVGDAVTLNTPSSGTYSSSSVGTGLTVSASGLSLGGGAASNYVLASNAVAAAIGTISPEPLTVVANSVTRGAGAANPALTFNLSAGALYNGDTLTGQLATPANTASPAGTYPITQGTLSTTSNYQISFVGGVLTVTSAGAALPPMTTTTAIQTAQTAVQALASIASSEAAVVDAATSQAAADSVQASIAGVKKASPQDIALAAIASFRAAACSAASAAPALFVVLPSATGKKIGGVVVNDGSNEAVLDQSFAAAEMSGGELSACRVSKSDISTTFQQAVSARPTLPHHFSLRFDSANSRFDPASMRQYRDVLADIAQRRTYQIEVITYAAGGRAPGDGRARAVAEAGAVRALLAHDLVDSSKIKLTARDDLRGILPSDQPAPPPDRLVEIWVR